MSLNTDDAAKHWIRESVQAVGHLPKMALAGAMVVFSWLFLEHVYLSKEGQH